MTDFPDVLEQDGLRLRPLSAQDLLEIAHQIDDSRVARWLAAVTRPFDAAAAVALLEHSRTPGEHLRLIERDGALVGGLCLGHAMWYWLAPEYWGQGTMGQALRLAISARFARPAPPLIATCHEDNSASRRLLARLGFAPSSEGRRMFFQSTQKSETCRDYVMAPEQWHLLHPPSIAAGSAKLRPARQKDIPILARILPAAGPDTTPWPKTEALPAFIETHRFRGRSQGLFVVMDENRRTVGMALIQGRSGQVCFLSEEDGARHRAGVEAAIAAGPLPAI